MLSLISQGVEFTLIWDVLIGTTSTYSDDYDDIKFELNVTNPGIVKGFFSIRSYIYMSQLLAIPTEFHWESTIVKCLPLLQQGFEKLMKEINRVYYLSFPMPWYTGPGHYWSLIMQQADFASINFGLFNREIENAIHREADYNSKFYNIKSVVDSLFTIKMCVFFITKLIEKASFQVYWSCMDSSHSTRFKFNYVAKNFACTAAFYSFQF